MERLVAKLTIVFATGDQQEAQAELNKLISIAEVSNDIVEDVYIDQELTPEEE